jgi:4-hydroxymandelate oxidase
MLSPICSRPPGNSPSPNEAQNNGVPRQRPDWKPRQNVGWPISYTVWLGWMRALYAVVRPRPSVAYFDLFGQEMSHPILLAPTSTHILAHPEGEVATARGAGAADAVMVISTLSNRGVEEITRAATRPTWFQLYVEDDRAVTKDLVLRAQEAGCRSLCITVDLPIVYARDREAHLGNEAPELPFPNLKITARPGGRGRRAGRSRKFNWKDLEWIQSFAKTPILLKGVLNPDDAEQAAKMGAAAVVVSNHGGRALVTQCRQRLMPCPQ